MVIIVSNNKILLTVIKKLRKTKQSFCVTYHKRQIIDLIALSVYLPGGRVRERKDGCCIPSTDKHC